MKKKISVSEKHWFPSKLSLLCALLAMASQLHAKIVPDPLFTDGAVLQRDVPIPIYGKGNDGEKVSASLNGKTASGEVQNGQWEVKLDPLPAGGPYSLTIRGDHEIVLKNILIGDVWVCGGQSNMAGGIQGYIKKFPDLFSNFPGNYKNDQIRYFWVQNVAADEPLETPHVSRNHPKWEDCNPKSALIFSAAGYFFSINLQPDIHVPLGLINASYPGTGAECWVPRKVIEGNKAYAPILDQLKKGGKKTVPKRDEQDADEESTPSAKSGDIRRPCGLFNGVIAPIVKFPIKGVIWYQGERNSRSFKSAILYEQLFQDVIKTWRSEWKAENLPFLFVQLPAYGPITPEPNEESWTWLRESQTKALSLPQTGMIVLTDAGSQKELHPPYKEIVGKRLAALAKAKVYNLNVPYSGPVFKKADLLGSQAVITFDMIGEKLVSKSLSLDHDAVKVDGNTLRGFSACGPDKVFHHADAKITGNDTVTVECPKAGNIVAVRYAWASFPLANLYNSDDFPAVPFRTDHFDPPQK